MNKLKMIFFFISYRTLFLFCYIQNGKNMKERTIYKVINE